MFYYWCSQGGCYYIYTFDYSLQAPRHLHTIKKSLIKYSSAIYEQRLPEPSSDSILDIYDSKHCRFTRAVKICVKLADKAQANPWRKEEHAHFTVPQEITILNPAFSNLVCCFCWVGSFGFFFQNLRWLKYWGFKLNLRFKSN